MHSCNPYSGLSRKNLQGSSDFAKILFTQLWVTKFYLSSQVLSGWANCFKNATVNEFSLLFVNIAQWQLRSVNANSTLPMGHGRVRYSGEWILLGSEILYKILIINPGAYFWSKGLFTNFFLGGGGGGGLKMDEYFVFWKCYFLCSSDYNFLDFQHTTCLYYWFFYIFWSSVIGTVNINYWTHTV